MTAIEILKRPGCRPVAGLRLLLAGLLAGTLCGCVRYDIAETNGMKFTNVRKPVPSKDKSYFTVKLDNGQRLTIPSSRIEYIVPHGESGTDFKN